MRSGFWRADWLLGGVVVALFALFGAASDLLPGLERKAYDLAVQASSRVPSEQVAVIAIDKQSVDNIGRWPWPRDTHARLIDILGQAKAKAVGYLVFFAEPENEAINRTLAKLINAAAPAQRCRPTSGATPWLATPACAPRASRSRCSSRWAAPRRRSATSTSCPTP